MTFNQLMAIALPITALSLVPLAANAACIPGPEVTVNSGHGASIVFDEPVYQAQVFDPSRLILQPIPQQGTTLLLLSQVEAQNFPGMPQTPTTSLTAQTEDSCYSFKITYADHQHHVSVDARPQSPIALRTPGAGRLPGGEDIDLAALRTGYERAVQEHGEDNSFLQRVVTFLELTEKGASQRLSAQQVDVQWSHLRALATQGLSERLLTNNATVGI